ncbi:MAG: DUF3365 domain-containing protein [Hyphomicrobium sp.]
MSPDLVAHFFLVSFFIAVALLSAWRVANLMKERPELRERAAKYAIPILLLLTVPFLLVSLVRSEEATDANAASLATARAAIKGLGENLKTQLVAAIKSGGPVSAVGVCRVIAPAIAADQSKAHGVSVRRTALKVRNQSNAPDDFERRVLEDFVRQIKDGADPAKLEHSEVVSQSGGRVFRYMKAIPTAAAPCLTCHGSNLEPSLKTEINRLYPDDQATGFSAGDLRGAFSVTQKLE